MRISKQFYEEAQTFDNAQGVVQVLCMHLKISIRSYFVKQEFHLNTPFETIKAKSTEILNDAINQRAVESTTKHQETGNLKGP